MGGWGPMFGTKSQINTVFFDTFPNTANLCFTNLVAQFQHRAKKNLNLGFVNNSDSDGHY